MTTYPLLANFLYNFAPIPPLLGAVLLGLLEMLLGISPKNFHQIKHNSQLLGCKYFLSRQNKSLVSIQGHHSITLQWSSEYLLRRT